MASGPSGGGGNHRWAESKVYRRKSHKTPSKPNTNSAQPHNPHQKPQQTLATTRDDVDTNHRHSNSHRPLVSLNLGVDGQQYVTISPNSGSPGAVRSLRLRLSEELDKVRSFNRNLEAQLAVTPRYSQSQLSADGTHPLVAPKIGMNVPDVASVTVTPVRRQLSVSVASGLVDSCSMSDKVEKEKRTPKANQYYRNSDFLLAKDKFPPPTSKKLKASGGKKHGVVQEDRGSSEFTKFYAQGFKSCGTLLLKLMKHKHGWVFNTPVDVKALGLHDYYSIVKRPMDLGTVKSRLDADWYKSPKEFGEDVRLTFRNAMSYNPKGQDVYVMAEQLSSIFEEHWPTILSEFAAPSKKDPPLPPDMRMSLERSDSTKHPTMLEATPGSLRYAAQYSGRTPSMKKPKARDPHKRDMTYDEKQRLSHNLQNLPSEKLDVIVQIIKKRNTSLSQHDDEIEVDIDSVDTETLWELDRLVTNYKKSLSKHKRKAELAVQARQEAEKSIPENNQAPVFHEEPAAMESMPDSSKHHLSSSSPNVQEKKANNGSRSSSLCSSSSDSGSSSSDSDSGSSSE